MAERIERYVPQMPAHYWAAIEDSVRTAVTEAEPATPYTAKNLMASVAPFVLWAWQRGNELDRRIIFDRWLIEEFIAAGCSPTWSPASRGTRRSQLFRVSEALLGRAARTPRVAPLPQADPSKPYSLNEMTALRSWAAGQRTPAMRRDAIVLLSLCAGAGLATEDLVPLRADDIDVIDGVVLVNVTGRRPRQVPVLVEWEDDLLDNLRELSVDQYVFRPRRASHHKNTATNFIDKTTGILKPNSQRLRATWIVHHLTAATPVKAFMAAAGVQSLEALTRYLAFVPDNDPEAARAHLRGELRR